MKTCVGWLLDLYVEDDKIVVWIKTQEDGKAFKFIDNYNPCLYVLPKTEYDGEELFRILSQQTNIVTKISWEYNLTNLFDHHDDITKKAMFSSILLPQSASAVTTTIKNPNFLTYQNSTYGVKIQYPSSWGVQTGVNTLDENGNPVQPIDITDIIPPIQSDPNAVAYFQIGVEQQLTPADTKNIDLYLRNIINAYRFNSTDFSIVSATCNSCRKTSVLACIHRYLSRISNKDDYKRDS